MAKIYDREKSPYWWARWKTPKGNWTRRSTGIPKKKELEEKAQLKANKMEADSWEEWHPYQKQIIAYPFDTLMIHFIQERDPGPADINCIERLAEFFAGRDIGQLEPDDISEYKKSRKQTLFRGKPISDSTIRRELSVFSSAINYARIEWGWNINNLVEKRKPAPGKGRIRWITPAEAKRLMQAAKNRTQRYPHILDYIELSLSTGMRKSEVLGAELKRIDLRNGVIHLNPDDQKNAEYSTIPLNRTARKVIMRRQGFINKNCPHSPWLFPNLKMDSDGRFPILDIKKGFSACLKEARIDDFRPHDLRHTFASWAVQAGVELYSVKEVLRHSSITQTEKYAHLAPKNKRDGVNVLDGVIESGAHYVAHRFNSPEGVLELMDEISIKSSV